MEIQNTQAAPDMHTANQAVIEYIPMQRVKINSTQYQKDLAILLLQVLAKNQLLTIGNARIVFQACPLWDAGITPDFISNFSRQKGWSKYTAKQVCEQILISCDLTMDVVLKYNGGQLKN